MANCNWMIPSVKKNWMLPACLVLQHFNVLAVLHNLMSRAWNALASTQGML